MQLKTSSRRTADNFLSSVLLGFLSIIEQPEKGSAVYKGVVSPHVVGESQNFKTLPSSHIPTLQNEFPRLAEEELL